MFYSFGRPFRQDSSLVISFYTRFKRNIHVLVIFLIGTLISACQTYSLQDSWPTEIPDRQIFIDSYSAKRAERNLGTPTDANLAYHLGWIKKFYEGTTLYPTGWLSVSEQFLDSIKDDFERERLAPRLVQLGIEISNEWAQENEVRLINSVNMATWADAMRTAAERQEQATFVQQVENDVVALLKREITSRDIQYERYFAEETFDDF